MKTLRTAQLAAYLDVTKRTIQRRATKEQWPYEEINIRGGTTHCYYFEQLPDRTKKKITAVIIAKHEQLGDAVSSPETKQTLFTIVSSQTPWSKMTNNNPLQWLNDHCGKNSINKNLVCLAILTLAREYRKQNGLKKINGLDKFSQCYNASSLMVAESVYQIIPSVSRITLLRWEHKEQQWCRVNNLLECDKQSGSRIQFNEKLEQINKEVLMIVPNISAWKLMKHLRMFFDASILPNEQQLTTWLNHNRNKAVHRSTNNS